MLKTLNIFQVFDIFNVLESKNDYLLVNIIEKIFSNGITYEIAIVINKSTPSQEYFFYNSSGTSRSSGDLGIKGIWFPVAINSLDELDNKDRVPKQDDSYLEDSYYLDRQIETETKTDKSDDTIYTTHILTYGRFINKNNALISYFLLKLSYAKNILEKDMLTIMRIFDDLNEYIETYVRYAITKYIDITKRDFTSIPLSENNVRTMPDEYRRQEPIENIDIVYQLSFVNFKYYPENLDL